MFNIHDRDVVSLIVRKLSLDTDRVKHNATIYRRLQEDSWPRHLVEQFQVRAYVNCSLLKLMNSK